MPEEPTLFSVRTTLDKKIRAFLKLMANHPSIEEGRTYVQQHGQFTMRIPEVGKNTYIVFTNTGESWHFTADSLSDDFIVIVVDNTWKLYHDRYGTGDRLVCLTTEAPPFIGNITPHQFQEIAWGVEDILARIVGLYTNEPAQPAPAPRGLSRREAQALALIGATVIVLMLCSGLFLAFLQLGD